MEDVIKVWVVEVTARQRVAYTTPEIARQHLVLQDDEGYAYSDEVTLTGPDEKPARIWIVDDGARRFSAGLLIEVPHLGPGVAGAG